MFMRQSKINLKKSKNRMLTGIKERSFQICQESISYLMKEIDFNQRLHNMEFLTGDFHRGRYKMNILVMLRKQHDIQSGYCMKYCDRKHLREYVLRSEKGKP